MNLRVITALGRLACAKVWHDTGLIVINPAHIPWSGATRATLRGPLPARETHTLAVEDGRAVFAGQRAGFYALGAAVGGTGLYLLATSGTTSPAAPKTATVNIQGSADGTNWFNIPYSLVATPRTFVVTALTITTAVAVVDPPFDALVDPAAGRPTRYRGRDGRQGVAKVWDQAVVAGDVQVLHRSRNHCQVGATHR